MADEVWTRVVRLTTAWEVQAARDRGARTLIAGSPDEPDIAHECGTCGAVLILESPESRFTDFTGPVPCRACDTLNEVSEVPPP